MTLILVRENGINIYDFEELKNMKTTVHITFCMVWVFILCSALAFHVAVSVVSSFGRGTSPLFPQNIQCSTSVTTLSDCRTTALDTDQCQEIAGVICEGLYIIISISHSRSGVLWSICVIYFST